MAVASYDSQRAAKSGEIRSTYEAALLLTPLDQANRQRGYSAYLPDSYAKARQYWDFSYGVQLPREPDGVGFARILTDLGEQIVPQLALVRCVSYHKFVHKNLM